ncbi:hypothetical protein PUNSTDRAFT_120546 [Punctularia strigosozonata HHB-11173 SS5]|uniref:uncharacterized protein n=1 Tax=Punctularia strigosozonata (strain HHB-11173) TaxID=741275 RepID=UPI00044177A0|nr:uncharacterized protein PUNSTDRAFT_120546 [Punctularia strigosozonata HHB-11173 SS5]EIN09163.1 hypothetical protein PUNSTDRAFT_120546 [Punctularia strigosozonata HHB-11173 SS5]
MFFGPSWPWCRTWVCPAARVGAKSALLQRDKSPDMARRRRYYWNDVWKPGFPHAWGWWIAAVCAPPIWAGVMLGWMVASVLVKRTLRRRRGRREEHYVLIGDGPPGTDEEQEVRTTKPWQRQDAGWWARVAFYGVWVLFGLYALWTYEQADDIRYRAAIRQAQAKPKPSGYGRNEKLFIAALFYNNAAIVPAWSDSLLAAIPYFGTENVFVSILESESSDNTPELLEQLASRLDDMGVLHRILTHDTVVRRPENNEWNARIGHLAALRNRALEPLTSGSASVGGGWDRVVFSNDVYVTPESWVELLESRGGDWDVVCGLDFNHFGLYDAWVIRDRVGGLAAGIWPYFFDKASREAVEKSEPAPVFACWNGIIAMQAEPFLPPHLRRNKTLSATPLSYPLVDSHPMASDPDMAFVYEDGQDTTEQDRWAGRVGQGKGAAVRKGRRRTSPQEAPALHFRAGAPGECYSSESFLVPYDMRRVYGLEKVYANPRVVLGYTWKYYVYFKYILRHWAVRWFVEKVYDGAWMQDTRMIVGNENEVWRWDGGDCQPWW